MIDIRNAAIQLVPYLKMCGSRNEADISVGRDDHYKPLYRVTALFIAPTSPYLSEVLDGEVPTKDQAKEIMKLANPYFVLALDAEEELFEMLRQSTIDAWNF